MLKSKFSTNQAKIINPKIYLKMDLDKIIEELNATYHVFTMFL